MTTAADARPTALERWFGLGGRTALVVGASSGLGARAARVLAELGADVGLYARRRDRLEVEAESIHALGRRTCVVEGT